jgi:hypothetical protein
MQPEAIGIYSGAMDSHYGAMVDYSGAMEIHTGAMKAHSKAVEAHSRVGTSNGSRTVTLKIRFQITSNPLHFFLKRSYFVTFLLTAKVDAF